MTILNEPMAALGPPVVVDPDAPSALAARLGPVIAGVSLAVTAGMLAWISFGSTGVEGVLADAAYTVPALLVTQPDDDGCVELWDGDGTLRDELCREEAEDGSAYFTEAGTLVVGGYGSFDETRPVQDEDGGRWVVIDPRTLEVVAETSGERPADLTGGEPYFDPYTESIRWPRTEGSTLIDSETDEVILDIGGPPGYRLDQGVISPDGAWVVARDERGRLIVAPVDGSGAPAVWLELGRDGNIDLWGSIFWE
ncbi:MAG: hypothetical protein ACI970_000297 [Myxococcota bacterium]|jgi:hypothetical protein